MPRCAGEGQSQHSLSSDGELATTNEFDSQFNLSMEAFDWKGQQYRCKRFTAGTVSLGSLRGLRKHVREALPELPFWGS